MLKKMSSDELCSYLQRNYIYAEFKSRFRPHHTTETALVRVTNDLLVSSDHSYIVLRLLDLNTAFDTMNRQQHSVG